MKRFIKFCLIAALILIVVGIVIGTAGSVAGGGYDVIRMIRNGELSINGDFFHRHFFDDDYDLKVSEEEPVDETLFDIDDIDIFEEGKEVLSGDIAKTRLEDTSVKKLDITLGGGELIFKESEDGAFYLEASKAEKLQFYVEDDTLKLKAVRTKASYKNNNMKVYFYLPKDIFYEEIEIELGAGAIKLEGLSDVGKLDVDIGAGALTLSEIECEELDAGVGAGELILHETVIRGDTELEVNAGHIGGDAQIHGDLDVKCSMGAAELTLAGREEDFNYRVQCAAGEVRFGNQAFTAVAADREIDNGAAKQMDLDCSLGGIIISFEE